ncbi:unnamed protein product [Phaedon cochleariae]|uniref:Beta-1,4-N-acetylgalactosaminyltransferase n=1 Tax=Phaedon cochleariae TaxID=80249 RepID=A0A9P0GQ17_PHACE|nr:unnamed protein product [Phaedon cochleariae]
MNLSLSKNSRLTYTYLSMIIISAMFLLSVVLNNILLNNGKGRKMTLFEEKTHSIYFLEQCNCPSDRIKYEIIPKSRKRLLTYKHRLAVLVPYRERFEELLEFAPFMCKFLNNQKINYDIYILNQVDHYRFNRASLINVGFLQIQADYDYIAMHDVDLLPLNSNLTYHYPEQPHHLAAPNLHPRYNYEKFIGGILLINRYHFQMVNGLSNRYWGWGLEDDEFYVRLKDAHLNISRPQNINTGRHDTFRHIHGRERKRDTVKCDNQREITRKRDRQTGLHDVKYTVNSSKELEIDGALVTVINIHLHCNHTATPWCDCSNKKPETEKTKKIKGK